MIWRGRLSVGLFAKLVITIPTEPFQQGPWNLVHLLLMIREHHLLLFNVKGERSRSWAKSLLLNLVNKIKTESFGLGPSNLRHMLVIMDNTHCFSLAGVKGQAHVLIVGKPCKGIKGRTVWVRTVKLGTCSCHYKWVTSIAFQGQELKVKVTCCE